MEHETILILGGYGNTGGCLARLLLKESDARLILAGRNVGRGEQLADELNLEFDGNRVSAIYANAADPTSLLHAFAGIDFVVMASSTTQYTHQVARAALVAKACFLDIQYSSQKNATLRSMTKEIQRAGCCFITDGGFHPGLPAFLVRYVAQSFDRLVIARVGSVIKQDWRKLDVQDSTVTELVELINDIEMLAFKSGKWTKTNMFGMSDFLHMDFGGEFGKQYCAPMLLEEMRLLPEIYPTLTDTGFYVGSFNWYVDWVIMPVAMAAMKIWPRAALKPMGSWMLWGLKRFSRPPYATMLKVEAEGEKAGHLKKVQVTISHPDGYLFTAIPVAACLLQYLDGSINKPGLWMQAHIVEPNRFLSDMQRMGITVQKSEGVTDAME